MARWIVFFSFFLISYSSHASDIYILEDKGRELSPQQVLKRFQTGSLPKIKNNRYNAGFTGSVFWLIVKAETGNTGHRLELGNAHINEIDFYVAAPEPVLRYQTGDYHPFRQRPINFRLFVFPLEASPGSFYLVKVDKHGESLQLDARILSQTDFYQQIANENLISGLLWGILVLILTFGCFLYITVREPLYLYFVLFILSSGLWIIADKGYGFQYFWPDMPFFASRARPVLNALTTATALQFMQAFMGEQRGNITSLILNLIKILSIVLALLFLFVPYDFHNLVYAFLIVLLTLSASALVLIPLILFRRIREGNRQAWFYLASVSMLLIFSSAELMIHGGGGGSAVNFLSDYGIQTGLIFHVVILNFGLAHRFNSYKNEKEHLLLEMNRKQNELTERIIETQEMERKKISDQLHDDIGSMLSLASLQISSVAQQGLTADSGEKLESAMEVLSNVSTGIRNMSHSLSPLAIDKYGFRNALLDLIKTINLARQIHVEHIIIGMEDSGRFDRNFLNDLYRIIRESLNNVIKHSKATHCLIQLIEYEDNISLMIEDNGVGIRDNDSDLKTGMGIANIRSKIEYFEGAVEITGIPGKGTLINIQLPLKTSRI